MSKMKFNEFQQKALDVPSYKNCLISAGAGSGKTAVLTEKVYNLIKNKEALPNELLVLTFTNAAAFGMKQKIINRMKDEFKEISDMLYSAHIQTFDSFTAFLVRRYADKLGISPSFITTDQALIDSKTKELIEEKIEKLYQEEDPRLINFLSSFCFKNDSILSSLLFELNTFLDTLSSKEYQKFIIQDKFFDEEELEAQFNELLTEKILDIKYKLDDFKDKTKKYVHPVEIYEEIDELESKLDELEDEDNDEIFLGIQDLGLNAKRSNKYLKEMGIEYVDAYIYLKDQIKDQIDSIKYYDLPSKQIETIINNQNAPKFLLDVIVEIRKKCDDYKFLTSSFTFNDISRLALKLLTEEEFKEYKNEIINTFKFILVDEYQDTNDIQEEFLDILSKNASLFVVGDIKQSIYRFRNANPTLFSKRKNKYLNDENSEVIDMNINYRSFEIILDYTNIIFRNVMNISEGGVDFNEDESLHYDTSINLYDENQFPVNNEFGFNILSSSTYHKDSLLQANYDEALIIIQDILDKIRNKYQVLDKVKDGKLTFRDIKFSDFAILLKRKKSFDIYKELFIKYNIPLNIVYDENIRDINTVVLIESLLKTVIEFKEKPNNDQKIKMKFNFVSLARSFLFEYDDETIFNLTQNDAYLSDSIYLKIKEFIDLSNKNDWSISEYFSNLLIYFDVIHNLNKIGNVDNSINKIEYLYTLIKILENSGKTILDFYNTLKTFDRYGMELKGSSNVHNDNSVELTTIHASKGLEYKIVYLSLLDSNYAYHPNSSTNYITNKYGFIFENKGLDKYRYTILKGAYDFFDKAEDYSEYIRLIYVALTRVKESLYFINPFRNANSKNAITKFLEKSFKISYRYNKFLYDDCFKHLFDKNLDDLGFAIDVLDALNNPLRKTSPILKDKIQTFNLEEFVSSVDEFLSLCPFKIFAKPLSFTKTQIKAYDNLDFMVDEFAIIKSDLLKEYIFKLKRRLYTIYYLMTYEENRAKITDKNELEIFDVILDKLKDTSSTRSAISEELFIFYLYLITGNKYFPLIEKYIDDPKIKTKNYNFDQEIIPFNGFLDKLPILDITTSNYEFKEKKTNRASLEIKDEDIYSSGILETGILYHSILELVDFKTKDLSFIKDSKIKSKIEKILSLDLFKNTHEYEIYKEYEYLLNDQKGVIDLLLIKEDEAIIIDYKTKKIDPNEYKGQLNTYRNAVKELFNIDNIKMYLISINDGNYEKVEEI